MFKKSMFLVALCLLLVLSACKADDSAKSTTSKEKEKTNSVHIQEEKVQQKTNPATVKVDNS